MGTLRCKTPELARKEVWAHVLAYNLIRTVMAQAAAGHDVAPRSISFTATLQVLEAFRPLIAFQGHRGAVPRGCYGQGLHARRAQEAAEDVGVQVSGGMVHVVDEVEVDGLNIVKR